MAPGAAGDIAQAVAAPRRKLAKERGEDLLEIAIGCTAFYQPRAIGGGAEDTAANWSAFENWLKIAADIGAKLAHFQSPTYRAIAVAMTPGEPIDGAQPAQPDDEAFAGDAGESPAVVAQRAYLRLVKAAPPRALRSRPPDLSE